jgi:low temperature requirement protein LtrA
VMVAGIIVAAVGDAVLIAHPTTTPGHGQLAAIAGGPALYLAGHLLFRRRMAGSWSSKRVLAMLAIIAAGIAGAAMPALASAGLILAVLVVLIGAEMIAGMRRRHHQELSPLEALEARITRQPAP